MDTITELMDESGEADRGIGEETHEAHVHSGLDPHIWLSPGLVKIQAATICDALIEADPAHADEYRTNLAAFQADLDRLHDNIAAAFAPLASRTMLVFHPAWGYFAREFGLVQLPIEIEGKEPGPRDLAAVIDIARNAGVRVIFVQPSSTQTSARAVADAIGGIVTPIDPLAEDYFGNLLRATNVIRTSLGRNSPVNSGAQP
jgi:zinc transport system substrate-binding protein